MSGIYGISSTSQLCIKNVQVVLLSFNSYLHLPEVRKGHKTVMDLCALILDQLMGGVCSSHWNGVRVDGDRSEYTVV